MAKLSIRELSLAGRTLFLRVDFNVPLADGDVSDDARLRAALPTIRIAMGRGARVLLASHLGRPKGKFVPGLSLRPVAKRLSLLLGSPVGFVDASVGKTAARAVADLLPGEVLLLENLRFQPGETGNDPEFARELASLADRYCNDAFGTAHRAHASTSAVPRLFHQAAAGLCMESELRYLGELTADPKRPFVAILGGAKVSDKIPVLRRLAASVDRLIIGGGMAYTFLKEQGAAVGRSLLEEDRLSDVKEIRELVAKRGGEIFLPRDHLVAPSPDAKKGDLVREIPSGLMGLDIGPETVKQFCEVLDGAKTILWNGPMGVFEQEAFASGTVAVAKAVAASPAISVVGGGDSVAALSKAGVVAEITHVSTGGGASLALLSGAELPGVAALAEASHLEVSARRLMVAGNWKMNLGTIPEASRLADEVVRTLGGKRRIEVVLAPPFPVLASVAALLGSSGIRLAAQNIHEAESGAFTGEVSARMARAAGCRYVILGHSERRHVFLEPEERIRKKMESALEAGLDPIVCVGETLQEREAGRTLEVVERQLESALLGLGPGRGRVTVAYEPVWAIGTGKTASPVEAQKMHLAIRRKLIDLFSQRFADETRILYGGSVKPQNAFAILSEPDVDGALIGGASLDMLSFAGIVRAARGVTSATMESPPRSSDS